MHILREKKFKIGMKPILKENCAGLGGEYSILYPKF